MSRALSKSFSVLAVIAGLALFMLDGHVWSGAILRHGQQQECSSRPLLLFIIDFDSFMCLSCLESFLELYNRLPRSMEEGGLWGVLLFDRQKEKRRGESFARIVNKKLKGFIQANNIKFPFVLDRFHIFEHLGKQGSAVLLFDPSLSVVKKFVFPLSQNQIKEILCDIDKVIEVY